MRKRLALAVVLMGAFLIGYGAVAEAWPYMGRSEYHGYFKNRADFWGDFVWRPYTGPSACRGTGYAIHTGINTKSEFINFVKCKLYSGNTQEIWGARFIIQTMRGGTDHSSPSASDIADWESRVNNPAISVDWGSSYAYHSYSINSYYQGSDTQDDAFYGENGSSNQVIRFIHNGSVSYMVRRQCANPVGSLPGLPVGVDFNMTGSTSLTDSTVVPNQQVTFSHTLTNNGPTATSPNSINWTTQRASSSSGSWSNISSGNAGTFTNGQTKTPSGSTENFRVPSNATPGTQYCRRISWSPDTESGGSQQSTPRCATVQYSFNLDPRIEIPGSRTVQQGDQVIFRFYVRNTGSTVSTLANCSLTGTQPSGTPAPPSTNCPRTFQPGIEVQVASQQTITIGNQPAGSRICRTLTVSPNNQNGGSDSTGAQCVVVAKTPYVHFMGGDVWAGGGFIQTDGTCTTNSSAKITTMSNVSSNAGSTVEYGAFALNDINRFGSGSKPLHSSSDFSALGRRLTFSNNTTTLGDFGAPQHCINDYSVAYESKPAVGTGTVDLQARPSGEWHSTGDLTVHGTMQPGSTQVYLVDGNVIIDGNVRYVNATSDSPTYSGLDQIPSLVIIAKGDIRVASNVTDIAGVFISRGTFYTCYPKPSPPTVSTCNNLLSINGSVIAGTLDLYRTRGGDGSTVQARQLPAEIFNLSPEVFLNNALNSTTSQSISTSFSRELPPRF